MKLNNRGVTTIEVILCFVLVSIIAMSMYSVVSAFNEKRIEESNRSKLLIYKSTLTQKIQNDFIKNGLVDAKITENREGLKRKYQVDMYLKDGSKRRLLVSQQSARCKSDNTCVSDEFKITYGPLDNMEDFDLPNLGETKGICQSVDVDCNFKVDPGGNVTTKDLKINNVDIRISNENNTSDNLSHILSIYIGFSHPDLGNKYAIDIVSPINYQ